MLKSFLEPSTQVKMSGIEFEHTLKQRISQVVDLCEFETRKEYDKFIITLKKIKEDPTQIHTYFYVLDDLFVQNIKVARMGYMIGLTDRLDLNHGYGHGEFMNTYVGDKIV